MKPTSTSLFKKFLLLTAVIVYTLKISSQEIDKGTIEAQFNYVIDRSEKLEDTRIVKTWQLYRLKSHVLDSLKLAENRLNGTKLLINGHQQILDSLQLKLTETNTNLNLALNEKNAMNFMGMHLEKAAYHSFMWLLTGALVTLVLFFFGLFKRSNRITIQTQEKLKDIQNQFESHRKRALEREEQIVRKLHDELNKYKSHS